MKKIGLLGGMSWESTVSYYQTINRIVGRELGGLHSAEILLYSVDFQEIEELQSEGRWEESGEILSKAAQTLEAGGADFLLIYTNTMHRVAPQIEAAIRVPLLHIADATAEKVAAKGLSRVGLLGTRFTMEQDFYRGRLEKKHDLRVLIPPEEDRSLVHAVIYEELCRGQILEPSKAHFRRIVEGFLKEGCEGVILGCTEIGLLIAPEDTPIPLFDTAQIHAEAAAFFALEP